MANRERFLHVLQDLTGQHVVVHKVDGTKEEGIFHTVSSTQSTKFSIVIKGAKALVAGKKVSGYRSVFIDASSVVQIAVESIVLKESGPRGGGFSTDTDISGGSAAHLNGRELAEVNDAWLDSDMQTSLEDMGSGMEDGKVWDQFEANYKLTGRRATYDENLYTTSLDTTKVIIIKTSEENKIEAHYSLAHTRNSNFVPVPTLSLSWPP